MRVSRRSLGSFADVWYCGFNSSVTWDPVSQTCVGTTAPAAGNVTAPGVPIDYASSTPTGAIPSNPTGLTTIPTNTDPNILASSLAQNQANQSQCATAGGTWNPNTGVCAPNYTPYIVLGAIAGTILLLSLLRR